jgi:hypothetical protein
MSTPVLSRYFYYLPLLSLILFHHPFLRSPMSPMDGPMIVLRDHHIVENLLVTFVHTHHLVCHQCRLRDQTQIISRLQL